MITTLINQDLIKLSLSANSKKTYLKSYDVSDAQGRTSDRAQFLPTLRLVKNKVILIWRRYCSATCESAAVIKIPRLLSVSINRASSTAPMTVSHQNCSSYCLPPDGGDNHHIEVPAELSTGLKKAYRKLHECSILNKKQFRIHAYQTRAFRNENNAEKQGFIIGVIGCSSWRCTHLFGSWSARERRGGSWLLTSRSKPNGSIGVKNSPTQEEISADAIVVACDNRSTWLALPENAAVSTNVKAPIKDAQGFLTTRHQCQPSRRTNADQSIRCRKPHKRVQTFIVTWWMAYHMIPVSGGILIALALAIGGEPSESGMAIPAGSMWNPNLGSRCGCLQHWWSNLGWLLLSAIADRPALKLPWPYRWLDC